MNNDRRLVGCLFVWHVRAPDNVEPQQPLAASIFAVLLLGNPIFLGGVVSAFVVVGGLVSVTWGRIECERVESREKPKSARRSWYDMQYKLIVLARVSNSSSSSRMNHECEAYYRGGRKLPRPCRIGLLLCRKCCFTPQYNDSLRVPCTLCSYISRWVVLQLSPNLDLVVVDRLSDSSVMNMANRILRVHSKRILNPPSISSVVSKVLRLFTSPLNISQKSANRWQAIVLWHIAIGCAELKIHWYWNCIKVVLLASRLDV